MPVECHFISIELTGIGLLRYGVQLIFKLV